MASTRVVDAMAPSVRERVTLWVSYQIIVEAVDGKPVDWKPAGPCVYYRVELPAGRHDLQVRLHYQSPMQELKSKAAVTKAVELEHGTEYRLLDLGAGQAGPDRVFTPWLQAGAPPAGTATPDGKD